MSGALAGSPRKISASVTATSGAEPSTTDAREAPASRTASVTKSCAPPGESIPASRNGHAAPACTPRTGTSTAAHTSATTSAVATTASVPTSMCGTRARPIRNPTLIPPKSSAERHARPTAVISRRPGPTNEPREQIRGGGLRNGDPRHDQGAAGPAGDAEPVVVEQVAEESGERRLEREQQRDARSAHPPLRPELHQVRERA